LTGDGVIDGFRFKFKNVLATGTLIAPLELSVDGKSIEASKIEIEYGDDKINSLSISPEKPLKFRVSREAVLTVRMPGGLNPGEHKIDIIAKTKEYGVLKFDIKDFIK